MVGTLVPTVAYGLQRCKIIDGSFDTRIGVSLYLLTRSRKNMLRIYIFQPGTDFEWIPGADLSNMYMY